MLTFVQFGNHSSPADGLFVISRLNVILQKNCEIAHTRKAMWHRRTTT